MEHGVSDPIIFLGRFHPLILHLPIGFLYMAFILELLSRFKRFSLYKPAVGLSLALGAALSIITAAFGYMLAREGGFEKELLALHQWSGVSVAFFAVAAAVLFRMREVRPSLWLDRTYLFSLAVMIASITVAGHYGGSLTHGSDYLAEHMPPFLRSAAGLPEREQKQFRKITNLQEALVFDDIIYPILDRRCVSCHNESKSKGDLQMHTAAAFMKGGESGPAFVPGAVKESDMMRRIYLPQHDDDHMPPKGKGQLTDAEIKLLAWWIAEGAAFDKKVAELKTEKDIQVILNALVDPFMNKGAAEKLLASSVSPADSNILQEVREKGIKISTLSESAHWLKVTIPETISGDSLIDDLSPLAEQITWLDLGYTPTTDKALRDLARVTKLTRLHLQNTAITDEGLHYLKDMRYLEYLNIYGTGVTDKGIQQLASLPNLKVVYLWKTQVTNEGVAKLKQALPDLEINLGMTAVEGSE